MFDPVPPEVLEQPLLEASQARDRIAFSVVSSTTAARERRTVHTNGLSARAGPEG